MATWIADTDSRTARYLDVESGAEFGVQQISVSDRPESAEGEFAIYARVKTDVVRIGYYDTEEDAEDRLRTIMSDREVIEP